ncbi:hypothetical protein TIFTF001_015833 [Ficus carica]|uniref:Uncharacterized protein n=1 Tax=Ficus carica TaxID=3494 RepID=A0AA88AM91_FICCA|nr:hypothetical protein TIFTF001_015833 [Ficus carica]
MKGSPPERSDGRWQCLTATAARRRYDGVKNRRRTIEMAKRRRARARPEVLW